MRTTVAVAAVMMIGRVAAADPDVLAMPEHPAPPPVPDTTIDVSKLVLHRSAEAVDLGCPGRAKPRYDSHHWTWSCGDDGPYVEMFPDTKKVMERGSRRAGKREGVVERFLDGALIERAIFRAGRHEGTTLELVFSNEQAPSTLRQIEYVNDRREGPAREVSSIGNPDIETAAVGQYVNDRKTGTWLEVRRGRVTRMEHYLDDKLDGPADAYDDRTGAHASRCWYRAGVLQRQVTYWQGRVSLEITEVDGKPSEEREYDASGKLSVVTTFRDGRKVARKRRNDKGALVDDASFEPGD